MLSTQFLGILRAYWRLARPQRYLFPGRDEDRRSVQPFCTPLAARRSRRRG
jgi:hypothetical protein